MFEKITKYIADLIEHGVEYKKILDTVQGLETSWNEEDYYSKLYAALRGIDPSLQEAAGD